ncbi:hypothetical protein G2W53_009429 [Senna tora]|uniref:Reverse transcriptase n=1 Tax=Senna tora TaxID=362788 RepID=A0A835C9X7_9FABA|nr:hypothetical protein G2W53_009429 [Senna tora]
MLVALGLEDELANFWVKKWGLGRPPKDSAMEVSEPKIRRSFQVKIRLERRPKLKSISKIPNGPTRGVGRHMHTFYNGEQATSDSDDLRRKLRYFAQNDKTIRGIKIGREAPTINHLMYADDVLLFFKADKKSCEAVKILLHQFGTMSGLWMNNWKSEIRFSPNISPQGARALSNIVNCCHVDHISKYLGGFIDGHNTARRNASLILDNLILRLSEASKCDTTMRKFFWGHWEDKHSLTMISWRRLCRDKKEGGLGFRQMATMNEALLAKQAWRILSMPHSLVSRTFLGKYRSALQNFPLTPKSHDSPLSKRICKALKIVTNHIGWRVGNGSHIRLDDTTWISPDHYNHTYTRLSDLMHPGGYWDIAKVAQVYD